MRFLKQWIKTALKQAAQLFDLWEYNSYVAHSQLYEATKDRVKFLKLLFPMLRSLNTDEDTAFLKDSPELHELIQEMDTSSLKHLNKH